MGTNKYRFPYGTTIAEAVEIDSSVAYLVAEFHPTKNSFTVFEISASGRTRVWWLCSLGHEWENRVADRTLGRGCPFCSGNRLLAGFNDLETVHSEIAREWNYERNAFIPSQVFSTSQLRVWWKCHKEHEWETKVISRNKGSQCPYCTNRKVLAGYNDLATKRPELVPFWHPTKNGESPSDVNYESGSIKWWVCKEGHNSQTRVNRREVDSCPICSGQTVLAGYNDLATLRPDLLAEWHPDLNEIEPTELTPSSNKVMWWKCNLGHDWQAKASNRAGRKGSRCPVCSKKKSTSRVEQAFREFFREHLVDINIDHTARTVVPNLPKAIQIDIVGKFGTTKTVIEYDGARFHPLPKQVMRDISKTIALLNDDYLVVRIRENDLFHLDLIHPSLYQINHKWSLRPEDIASTGNQIIAWLQAH